jgi:hypothetical protein
MINCENCGVVPSQDGSMTLPQIDFTLAKEDKKLQADISHFETICPQCKS